MRADDLQTLIREPGVSLSFLAARAGVSRTTIWTARNNIERINLATMRELVLALGRDLVLSVEPASDPLAAVAARRFLGDLRDDTSEASLAEIDEWLQRLFRYAPSTNPLDLVVEAARLSAPQHRAGTVFLKGRSDPARLTSAGIASESQWALSGGPVFEALDATRPETGSLATVMWTQDVSRVLSLLRDTHEVTRVPTSADVLVAPAHASVFVGTATLGTVRLVSPIQGVIDSLGVGGGLGEIALDVANGWR